MAPKRPRILLTLSLACFVSALLLYSHNLRSWTLQPLSLVEPSSSAAAQILNSSFSYITPPALSKLPKIAVDVRFHHYSDSFGFLNLSFSHQDLVTILSDVVQTWARAGIYVRFKSSDVSRSEWVPDDRAHAYRWWVTRSPKWTQEQDLAFLSTYFDPGAAKGVIARSRQYDGHALVNWVLQIYGNAQTTTTDIDIYAVKYWYWYNGGAARGRIFVRAGSCNSPQANLMPGTVLCDGWPKAAAQTEMSIEEMARVMAHELGHLFGLAHPGQGACQVAPDVAHMQLMRQQRAVSVRGHESCGEGNPLAKQSRHLEPGETARARQVASEIAARQRAKK